MNENEDFEPLRRLLALKQHEIPPPGYFNNFSGQVMARIRAGEAGSMEMPWFLRFMQFFEAKPAFAGAFACGLCLLLLSGIVFAGSDSSAPEGFLTQINPNSEPVDAVTALPQTPDSALLASVSSNSFSSLQPMAASFGQANPFIKQVSLMVPGN